MPLRKCQEILLEFGLTPTQARVYLAAARLGMAPVSRVAHACDVRREDTYRALAKLEEMGLVEKIMHKPVQVRALPAEEVLTVLTKNWKDAVKKKETALTLRKQDFLKYFEAAKKIQQPTEENHYALLLEKDAVFRKVIEMLNTSEKEINAITSAKEMTSAISAKEKEIPQMLHAFSETLRKKSAKPVKVRIILETPSNGKLQAINLEKRLHYDPGIELKYAFKPLSHYIIVDFKNVLLATSREPSIGTVPYLWTETPDFAQLLQRHFEELWNVSSSLQQS